ncbi:hypothetical protein D049_2024B, partial [Vibrio parahaemolyticus VPTS-2010]
VYNHLGELYHDSDHQNKAHGS